MKKKKQLQTLVGRSAIRDLKWPYVIGEEILNLSCRSFQVVGALKQKAVSPSLVFALGIFKVSQSLERVLYVTGFHSNRYLIYIGRVPSIALKMNRYVCFACRPTRTIPPYHIGHNDESYSFHRI